VSRPRGAGARIVVAAALLAAPVCASGQQGLDRAQNLIATISAQFEDGPSHGAGVVVSGRDGSIYVVTANHVVRRHDQQAARITVRFRFMPGESVPGRVLDDYDETLDLAVLIVERDQRRPVSLADVPFQSLGEPERLRRGDDLYAIGNPLGQGLDRTDLPLKFREREGGVLRFAASALHVGYSGGGLFDSSSQLVGVVTRDKSQYGEATSVSVVIDKLKRWGYPVSLVIAAVALPPSASPKPRLVIPAHVVEEERRDFGVRPQSLLNNHGLSGPTPTSIPGGYVISTAELDDILYEYWRDPRQRLLVFDVSGPQGPPFTLPGAALLYGAELGGDFRDEIQFSLTELLDRLTGGDFEYPMVFYCAGAKCWNSYNAALRAIHLGYRRVYWYRGGLWAWREAGIDVFPERDARLFRVIP